MAACLTTFPCTYREYSCSGRTPGHAAPSHGQSSLCKCARALRNNSIPDQTWGRVGGRAEAYCRAPFVREADVVRYTLGYQGAASHRPVAYSTYTIHIYHLHSWRWKTRQSTKYTVQKANSPESITVRVVMNVAVQNIETPSLLCHLMICVTVQAALRQT